MFRFVALALCAGPLMAAGLRAGAAKAAITPDLARFNPVYIAGFGQNRIATGVHDDLYARCVAVAAGGRPLVVCAVDSIGLFFDDVKKIRAAVPKADVVVAATHDHEAPDTMGLWGPARGKTGIDEEYNALVVRRTAETAKAALRALQPATAKLAKAHPAELDSFIHDSRPPVRHDAELVVLSLAGKGGKPIATVLNWANHPETLGSKNTLLTADYVGYLCARLEEKAGGLGVLWNGAVGGMQSPLGATVGSLRDDSFEKAAELGRRVADAVLDAVRGAPPAKIDRVEFRETMVEIPVTNPGFRMALEAGLFGARKKEIGAAPVGLIRMGKSLEIALVPGELYPELSVGGVERYPGADFPDAEIEPAIKGMMRAPFRMLIGLANDEIGYIIPKAEWDEKPPYLQNATKAWYGEVNSPGPDAAPRIVAALRDLLRR